MLFCLLVTSYNKLEEDFQTATDPLRAYNDYLEEVESISMNGWHGIIFVMREKYQYWPFLC